MGLKAPSLLTFMVSVLLTAAVLFTLFFKAQIPFVSEGNTFWTLLGAQVLLILGCTMRRL